MFMKQFQRTLLPHPKTRDNINCWYSMNLSIYTSCRDWGLHQKYTTSASRWIAFPNFWTLSFEALNIITLSAPLNILLYFSTIFFPVSVVRHDKHLRPSPYTHCAGIWSTDIRWSRSVLIWLCSHPLGIFYLFLSILKPFLITDW